MRQWMRRSESSCRLQQAHRSARHSPNGSVLTLWRDRTLDLLVDSPAVTQSLVVTVFFSSLQHNRDGQVDGPGAPRLAQRGQTVGQQTRDDGCRGPLTRSLAGLHWSPALRCRDRPRVCARLARARDWDPPVRPAPQRERTRTHSQQGPSVHFAPPGAWSAPRSSSAGALRRD